MLFCVHRIFLFKKGSEKPERPTPNELHLSSFVPFLPELRALVSLQKFISLFPFYVMINSLGQNSVFFFQLKLWWHFFQTILTHVKKV